MNSWEIVSSDPAVQFIETSRAQLRYWSDKIVHCLEQLSDEQLWWRPHPDNNAVGNIILHLCGNMTQWLIDAIPGRENHRDRPAEFRQRDELPRGELIARLRSTVAAADAAMETMLADPANRLMQPRRVQGFDINLMAAIHDAVPHVGGHAQEIVWITRLLLGPQYRFHWVPSTKEQGAP